MNENLSRIILNGRSLLEHLASRQNELRQRQQAMRDDARIAAINRKPPMSLTADQTNVIAGRISADLLK